MLWRIESPLCKCANTYRALTIQPVFDKFCCCFLVVVVVVEYAFSKGYHFTKCTTVTYPASVPKCIFRFASSAIIQRYDIILRENTHRHSTHTRADPIQMKTLFKFTVCIHNLAYISINDATKKKKQVAT